MNVRSSITHLFFAAGFECSATYTIVITAPAEHTRHHRAAPVSAFTRVFDALWARDPVIQHFTKKMDRPLSRAMTGSGLGDDGGMR